MGEQGALVFVVDDDACLRSAIENLLRSAGFAAQSFGSAHEFLTTRRNDAPACLVLDVRLPGTSGLELQRVLAQLDPTLPIVFITGYGDIATSVRAIKAGAVEFLSKPFREQDLLDAVAQALEQARVARQVHAERELLRARMRSLTRREKEVLDLVVTGLMNKQIAKKLGISEVTVKIHRGQVMQKMGASSLLELVRMVERCCGSPAKLDGSRTTH